MAAPETNETQYDNVAASEPDKTQDDNVAAFEPEEPEEAIQTQPQRKRKRGPTKMKHIAKDPNTREKVEINNMGELCGPGSVTLASYLGPLV